MSGKWIEVIRLRFSGQRFRDRALDVDALAELSQFQKIVAETAKALWRTAHPERQRLPKRFEERTRLCLRKIESGSAVTPLEVFLDETMEPEFWEKEPAEANQAISLACETFQAGNHSSALPERFPKHLVSEYAKLGQALREDEFIEIIPPRGETLRLTRATRESLTKFAETSYQDVVTIRGEVHAADVRQMQFRIWIDDHDSVPAVFGEGDEETVTTALKEHKSVRVKVAGVGEFSPDGVLQRITSIDTIHIVPPAQMSFDFGAPAIEVVLREIAAQVPPAEWAELPKDLASNLDHYIYGTSQE